MSNSKLQTTVYPNLFHFVHQVSSHKLPICSIHLYCDIGSSFETDELRGVAHFLEHMLFQGTKTKSSQILFQEYDQIGSEFNAFTTKRYTCFYVKCHEMHGERALSLFEDMMKNSAMTKERVKKEKEIIKQENKNRLEDYRNVAKEAFDTLIYKNSSFEKPVDNVRFYQAMQKITYKNLEKWYKWFYKPSNMVLSIVSKKPFGYWTNLLFHSQFTRDDFHSGKIDKPQQALSFPTQLPYEQTRVDILHTKQKGSLNTHLIFGFRTVNQYSDKKYIFDFISYILNGMSGRLFTVLRHENNLVYNVHANSEEEEYTGYFSVYTEFSNKHLTIVLKILLDLFENLRKNGILMEEFEIGRSRIHGSHHVMYENINTFAKYNGFEQLVFIRDTENSKHYHKKSIIPFQKILEHNYDRITLTQVNNIVKEYFRKKNMIISIVSSNNIPIEEIRSLCEKYP